MSIAKDIVQSFTIYCNIYLLCGWNPSITVIDNLVGTIYVVEYIVVLVFSI